MKIVPIILSGGSGTRLWPLSRELYPKQFLPLVGDDTMFQATVKRLAKLENCSKPVIVCNDEHRFLVAEQLRQIEVQSGGIILEPEGRNTAPALVVAALHAISDGGDPLLIVMPADHDIKDIIKFSSAVNLASNEAEKGALLTFGIPPDGPHTGYGYIKAGKSGKTNSAVDVEQFVEKPDLPTAQQYLDDGNYYWNSGIFLFKASVFLQELKKYRPEIIQSCRRAMSSTKQDMDFIRMDNDAFLSSPSDSIDYAVMEHTESAKVIPLDAGWSDVGSWTSLWEVNEKDDNQNTTHGDVMIENVSHCSIYAEQKLVAAVGVENLIIVETGDAVLVMNMEDHQNIKAIVNKLLEGGREEALLHRKVSRPWGTYECIDVADRYQVKRITVKPGEKLSLQMHHHRAEHWIIVKGTARVTRGSEEFMLSENESTYIPIGTTHRLENPGKIQLELIEVQSGTYLGEDDIVRFEDSYGRIDNL